MLPFSDSKEKKTGFLYIMEWEDGIRPDCCSKRDYPDYGSGHQSWIDSCLCLLSTETLYLASGNTNEQDPSPALFFNQGKGIFLRKYFCRFYFLLEWSDLKLLTLSHCCLTLQIVDETRCCILKREKFTQKRMKEKA